MTGLVHIYCGDGKGKTTAATGLALRAAGAGKRVMFCQFLKDGSSAEIEVLASLKNVNVIVCKKPYGFFYNMSAEEKQAAAADYYSIFKQAVEEAETADVIVMDEIIATVNMNIVPEIELIDFIKNRPSRTELIFTGRSPSRRLLQSADYVTEMKKIKHPYDSGMPARRGIEY